MLIGVEVSEEKVFILQYTRKGAIERKDQTPKKLQRRDMYDSKLVAEGLKDLLFLWFMPN